MFKRNGYSPEAAAPHAALKYTGPPLIKGRQMMLLPDAFLKSARRQCFSTELDRQFAPIFGNFMGLRRERPRAKTVWRGDRSSNSQ
jgi:hypothetical protein